MSCTIAHRLPHTASCVCTLSSWIQHIILSIILFSQIWELQNSIFPGSILGLGKNVKMLYPRRWELACRFHVPMRLLSALFHPATAAVCLGKTFWESKLTAWITEAVAYWQIYAIVHSRDGVRACENTVRCPDDCPFQVSSLWPSQL